MLITPRQRRGTGSMIKAARVRIITYVSMPAHCSQRSRCPGDFDRCYLNRAEQKSNIEFGVTIARVY